MDARVRELFGEGRNFPVLATNMADGAPHAISLWTGIEGDQLVFFTSPQTVKGRNVARDPRVALSVVDLDKPYRTARIRGRVVRTIDGDEAMRIVDRISRRYVGTDFPMRNSTVYFVDIERASFQELPFEHGG